MPEMINAIKSRALDISQLLKRLLVCYKSYTVKDLIFAGI